MTLRLTEEQYQAQLEKLAYIAERGPKRTHRIATKTDQELDAEHARKLEKLAKAAARNDQEKVKRVPERIVLRGCLEVLRDSPKVAFAWRQNVGMAFGGGEGVRFGFRGCSDILAVLKGGRFLAVECKGTGKQPSPAQVAFLANVHAAGAIGICVDDPVKLAKFLGLLERKRP